MKRCLQAFAAAMLILMLTLQCILLQGMILLEAALLRPNFYDRVLYRGAVYGQARQLILKAAQEQLRFGRTGLPYLESALTEDFLREELMAVLSALEDFLKGRTAELPVLPIYRLKDKVAEAVAAGGRTEAAPALVQFWFDPLTDEVRFAYFTGTEPFHRLRDFLVKRCLVLALSVVLSAGLFWLYGRLRRSFWEGCLCLGSALTASGGLMTGIGLVILYTARYGAVRKAAAEWAIQYGVPEGLLPSLLHSISGLFSLNLFAAALLCAILGSLILHIVPIQKSLDF